MIEVAFRQTNSDNDNQHRFLRSPGASSSSSPSSSSSDAAVTASSSYSSPSAPIGLSASLSDFSATPLQIKPLKAPPSPLATHSSALGIQRQQQQQIPAQQERKGSSSSSSGGGGGKEGQKADEVGGLGLATGAIDAGNKQARFGMTNNAAQYTVDGAGHDVGSSSVRQSSSNAARGISASVHRIRRGQKLEDLQLTTDDAVSLQQIDSPFQLQEYLALLVRQRPHDVDAIVKLPQATVALVETFDGGNSKGKSKEEDSGSEVFMGMSNGGSEEEVHLVDADVWVYEQLRRIVADLTTPWLTSLQRDCDSKQRPKTCDAMNADDWMYLCASHGEEKQCCAIDYIIHTLDGTTALLNSHRHFPSRTYIPTTSLRHFGSVSRRLSRIFVHAFEHHRDVFEACEAETSLYARFLALVQVYDLIAIESLPKLGVSSKTTSAAAKAVDEAASQAGESVGKGRPVDDDDDAFVPRNASHSSRQLYDDHRGDASGVPKDETGEEDDADDLEPLAQKTNVQRSDSSASRITAIHVGSGQSSATDEVSDSDP